MKEKDWIHDEQEGEKNSNAKIISRDAKRK